MSINAIKKSWISSSNDRLYNLSIESIDPYGPPHKLTTHELDFPQEPTEEHPKRHVVTLGLLSENDLVELHNTLAEAINIIRS